MSHQSHSNDGRVVIITGASSGIGRATALECAARGMRVVLAARREAALLEVADRIREQGGPPTIIQAVDVRSPEQIDALIQLTLESFQRIDILIANAGISSHTPFAEIEDSEIEEVVAVNLLGVMRCARAVIPTMQAQGNGHIIVIGSVIDTLRFPGDALYAATKAGVHRFAHGLAPDLRQHGIHISCVAPGVLDTPLNEELQGLPKADVRRVAADIVALMNKPRPLLVTPAAYRWVMAAHRIAPGLVEGWIARQLGKGA